MGWLVLFIMCFWMGYCHFQTWKIVMDYSGDKERAGEGGHILPAITGEMNIFIVVLYIILGILCLNKFLKPFLQSVQG